MERATLSANERIKNSIEITTLIREGQAFFYAPYKVHYLWLDKPAKAPWVRVAFAVPKRKFSKAVQRNRIKRLSREAYRLQKTSALQLAEKEGRQLTILFVYQKTNPYTFQAVLESIKFCLNKIISSNG